MDEIYNKFLENITNLSSGFYFFDGSYLPYIYSKKNGDYYYEVTMYRKDFILKSVEDWFDKDIRFNFVNFYCQIFLCKIGKIVKHQTKDVVILNVKVNRSYNKLNSYEVEYISKKERLMPDDPIENRFDILDL